MKIKNEENPDLSDFNLPGFKSIKIFIMSRDDYLKKTITEIDRLLTDDIKYFYSFHENHNIRGTTITEDVKNKIYDGNFLLEYLKYKKIYIVNLIDFVMY